MFGSTFESAKEYGPYAIPYLFEGISFQDIFKKIKSIKLVSTCHCFEDHDRNGSKFAEDVAIAVACFWS